MNRPWLLFSLPLLVSVLSVLVTFRLPAEYLSGLGTLLLLALLAACIDMLLQVRLPDRHVIRQALAQRTHERPVAMALAWLITAACMIDLFAFPLPLRNPSIYANFEGGRSYVRHISNMCWILPVIGIACARSKVVRALFIVLAITFPVLVLDRNRLFASAFALVAMIALFSRTALPWKRVLLAGGAALLLFSQLGRFRSGNLEWISLPFSDTYQAVSPALKWILLYLGAGVYNFSAISAKDYRNDDLLINQIVPGAGSVAEVGAVIPFDEPVINVGTEYFPFLLAFGPVGALAAGLCLFLGLVASVALLRYHASPFTLLIFLRMSYVCLMAGFAPQAYTWTNLAFVGLCFGLLVLSSMLPRKRMSGDFQAP